MRKNPQKRGYYLKNAQYSLVRCIIKHQISASALLEGFMTKPKIVGDPISPHAISIQPFLLQPVRSSS